MSRLWNERSGVRIPAGATFFSSPYRPHRLWNPSRLLLNGYRNASQGTQKLEGGVAHSPPNVTVNNGCYHVCPNMQCWHGKGQRDKFVVRGHHVRQGTEDKVLGSVLILLT